MTPTSNDIVRDALIYTLGRPTPIHRRVKEIRAHNLSRRVAEQACKRLLGGIQADGPEVTIAAFAGLPSANRFILEAAVHIARTKIELAKELGSMLGPGMPDADVLEIVDCILKVYAIALANVDADHAGVVI